MQEFIYCTTNAVNYPLTHSSGKVNQAQPAFVPQRQFERKSSGGSAQE